MTCHLQTLVSLSGSVLTTFNSFLPLHGYQNQALCLVFQTVRESYFLIQTFLLLMRVVMFQRNAPPIAIPFSRISNFCATAESLLTRLLTILFALSHFDYNSIDLLFLACELLIPISNGISESMVVLSM